MWPSYGVATPPGLLAHRNCISELSNEVYTISVGQVSSSGYMSCQTLIFCCSWNFTTKTASFFNCSFLTARIFRTTCATEKIYTSFESPEIQLSWARGTKDVADKQSRHAHFNKNDWVSLKWVWRLYLGATASVLLAHTSWITGVSNEVYNLSVAQGI